MEATELKIVWSKKDGDHVIHYPRRCDGSLIQSHICGNNYMWDGIDGKDKGWLNYRTFNLMEELEKRGYDLKTLKFSIKLKQDLTNKGESRKK